MTCVYYWCWGKEGEGRSGESNTVEFERPREMVMTRRFLDSSGGLTRDDRRWNEGKNINQLRTDAEYAFVQLSSVPPNRANTEFFSN